MIGVLDGREHASLVLSEQARESSAMNRTLSALTLLSIGVASGSGVLLPGAGGDDADKELAALRGRWKAVALEADGKSLPREAIPDFLFIIGTDGKSTGRMGKAEYQARVSVDPTKNPRTIDNVHETGPHKGKTQFGIYKAEDGKWVVCMTAPGAAERDRPKTFDTTGTGNAVFIFKLVKDDKKP
jgi:uncharacterized protein (TIGR03067 family)